MADTRRPADRTERRRAEADLILRGTLAVVTATATALVAVSSGAAHEGPATDVLERTDVFLPISKRVPAGTARRLDLVVQRARAAGHPIKVAVIAAPSDLGDVYPFWGHPQSYARFLGSLLKLGYRGDLLVVMPAGFGLSRSGRDRDRLPLRRLRVQPGADALTDAATTAVAAVAKASGHSVSVPAIVRPAARKENDHRLRDRVLIAAAGAALVAAIVFRPLTARRRARTTR